MSSKAGRPYLLIARVQHTFYMIGRVFIALVRQRLSRLVPVVAVLILLALLLMLLSSSNPLAPFLYPLL